MTADPAAAVSPLVRRVSVDFVNTLVARLTAIPASPVRWLSDLMDEADDLWELDDDDLGGATLAGRVKGLG